MSDYRVLVTGSQLWTDEKYIFEELDWEFEEYFLASGRDIFVLVHGDCPNGADAFAKRWAESMKLLFPHLIRIEGHPADWKGPRKRGAGYARNAEMVKLGANQCHAFILDESKGSTHCSELAEKAGIPTQIHRRTSVTSTTLEVKRTALARRDLTLKNVQIIYKNFEGREEFNQVGNRSFHVLLDPAVAAVLEEQGYNVKRKPALEEGGEEFIHMKVKVSFKGRPPTVALISRAKGTRNTLTEDTVELADHADFERIDITISPYDWKLKSGQTGRTAYLTEFFGFLYQSPLEELYGHYIEESEAEALEFPQDLGFEDDVIVTDTGWEQEGDQRAIEA
jgi:hypothetical protein